MKIEKPTWKNGKKCAVMVSVNLNAELFWLQLDPSCIDMPKTLSLGQYGMTRGVDRVLKVLEDHGVKATFFTPGKVAEMYGEKLCKICEKGHEIASLGYAHENMALLTEDEQLAAIEKSIDSIRKISGQDPIGFRSPEGELTLETLAAASECGLLYSSNLSDDDRPYFHVLKNNRSMLEIPIHWVNYDLPYFAFNYRPAFPAGQDRIAPYRSVISNWIDEFDGAFEYGLCYVLQIDPAFTGGPGRIELLEELLNHIDERRDEVWFATGREIYEYYNSK